MCSCASPSSTSADGWCAACPTHSARCSASLARWVGTPLLSRLWACCAASRFIVSSIDSKAGPSCITIGRPFPNETPGPFASWREFFEKAELESGKAFVGRPMLNIESHIWMRRPSAPRSMRSSPPRRVTSVRNRRGSGRNQRGAMGRLPQPFDLSWHDVTSSSR